MGRYGSARGVVAGVAAGMVLVGCSSEPAAPGRADASTAGASASAGPGAASRVAEGAVIGGRGTPCVLPVSFTTAAEWTAERVTVAEDPDFAALAEQGPVTLACEVDAKPAGNIGFLRVWTGDDAGAEPRKVLEGFVGAEKNASKAAYTETKAGALPAAEVTYTVTPEFGDGPKPERAFAVATPAGPVVVHLGGLDAGEHRAMLPAYELARRTLALTG
ncbi:lipoprotein [Streptomyces sp. NPDC016309]|uniref:lipoprotein n=1 Tax=Streptomyces sp. NPDC016309 TaxID=3364965 RepID=UPI0036F60675